MKISDIEIFHVKPRYMFLKISTDEGIIGYGEPVVEGKSRVVEAAIREFKGLLLGQDPRNIEFLWQLLYRGSFYRGGPVLTSAISGIEQALWDIKGKAAGLSIYDMLGGKVRDKIKMYPHIRSDKTQTFEEQKENAKLRVEQGFKFVKYTIPPMEELFPTAEKINIEIDKVSEIRKIIGEKVSLAIDFHGRFTPSIALQLIKKLEKFQPAFIEEPVLPEYVEAMAAIKSKICIPIATGERLFTKYSFMELFKHTAVDIVQPDLCHCGGIFEGRKIAAIAESNFALVAPHNPLGPISLASCIQLDACIPNFVAQEHSGTATGIELGVGILKDPFVIKNGYVDVPVGKPGLGIEIDEEALKEYLFEGNWQSPILFSDLDGSQIDW